MEKLTFTTPAAWENATDFGCATLYFANTTDSVATYEKALNGTVLTGTYEEILESAKAVAKADAAIVLFGNAGEENEFLKKLQKIISCPMVGGGAAFADTPGLVTGKGEAAVFFIQDDRYTFETVTQCIHEELVDTCHLTLADPRTILTINGQDAGSYLAAQKEKLGLALTDFEHLTLTDKKGVNAHLSCHGNVIKSGRDLDETMELRYVAHEKVYDTIRKFYDDGDAIIFGCAGLGGLLDKPLNTQNLGLFLFGEVCTVDGLAEFGNLMLSKLRVLPK